MRVLQYLGFDLAIVGVNTGVAYGASVWAGLAQPNVIASLIGLVTALVTVAATIYKIRNGKIVGTERAKLVKEIATEIMTALQDAKIIASSLDSNKVDGTNTQE